MNNSDPTNSQGSPNSATPQEAGLSPWQMLKRKRISYLTLPLLIMATLTEFVILATGWKYQQVVCLPKGMGVVFFGIGPIGATILAVELLKLPLAIWTASRQGFQKGVMLFLGLPLICLLTFQLVKDMAVYEMGVALTPASQMLKEAMNEEVKITQLNGDLAAVEVKKADRDRKLAELAARKAKSKAEFEDSLKRNEDTRQDAISLTDYQKKELSEVEARQATIIKQFDADAAQLTKTINDLRTRRETEVGRATQWNAEEARIENAYKARLADYTNKKAAYDKEKAAYDSANVIKRQFMKEPLDPGVPPERESNTILKPTLIAEIDAQIKDKEAELLTVNNQRRDRVAQVEKDAHQLREQFEGRSSTKREETDRKREELLAAQAALDTQFTAEEKQIDQEYEAAAQKVDGLRAEIDDSRKKAEGFYEARETAIQNTQVHRIATTVEIVRGLLMGQRPVSIKATAKERGDLYTDQISMVRIWVYPVLAFLVAFLPTLMVEIGFSTIFQPEQQRPPHRLGFFGRRLHWLYMRAGRQKILRAERLASQASAEIALREKALAAAKATADQALAIANAAADQALVEKETELQAAREAINAAAVAHNAQLTRKEQEHEAKSKIITDEWVAKLAGMADSLNRTVIEKDALRDLQKSEIERQIQMRQNAWSDRLTQMRQELDDQRNASEAERTAMMQAHHKKLMEVSEDCKAQVIQARRQAADAELAAVETTAKLAHDLKEALHARDTAEAQLQQQADSFDLKLTQTKEDAVRELEKVSRQEKHRFERQQLEFTKTLRQREEDFEHQLKQREQELSLGFDARLVENETRIEQDSHRREAELERQLEARALEVDARWKQEVQQREEASQTRFKQREQQLQAQAEARLSEAQTQAEQEFRRRESELERQLEAQSREAEARLKEVQQREEAAQTRLKQREQQLQALAEARLSEAQAQAEQEFRRRESELERQLETQSREADARLNEVQQREEAGQTRLKQREQQLQVQAEARLSEAQTQAEQEFHRRKSELERQLEAQSREADARLKQELQQKELAFQAKLKLREQELTARADAREAELQNQWSSKLQVREEEWQVQAESRVRSMETRLTLEAQQKEEAAQAKAKQHEQDLVAQITSQAEARHMAAQAQWDKESEKRMRAAIEPLKALLTRTEKERDEARETASESAHHVEHLEKKLTEASSFLNGWRNGNSLARAA